ncbi:MAG: arnC [Gammaproteobacteria bacterium]|nr:arnC [Gammaproteobacteria bacterium]
MTMPYLTVVIPVYNEAGNLYKLYDRLMPVLDGLGKPFEVIFTNDGSKDDSFKILKSFYDQRPTQIRVIDFNGNFGQHMAIMAGFSKMRGEVAITLDADLQNPPEEIPNLLAAFEQGHDYVEGVRQNRQDTSFRRYASRLNNKIRHFLTKVRLEDQGSMLRAYSKRIVELMVQSNEPSTYIPALAYSFSINPISIPVHHSAREVGESKYTLFKLLRLNFDLMTGFSTMPLQIFTMVGMGVSVLSVLLVVVLILRRIFIGPEVEGVFTLFAIMYLLIGILLMGLGIVGEYVGRIYQDVRPRPLYVVRETLE